MDSKKIGFIGLGNMGEGMAANLAKKFPITIWNRSTSKSDDFVKKNANVSVASSAGDIVSKCDIIYACVSDPAASDAVVFGENGVLSTMT